MIDPVFVLAGHSLRRIRGLLVAAIVLLAAFEFLLTQMAAYLFRRMAFSELAALFPDMLRTFAGPSGFAFLSFSGVVGLGYFHPVVVTALIGLAIAIATEPCGEVERRFVDLALARPMTRRVPIARTLIVLVVAIGLVLGAMMGGTEIGLHCCTPADAPRPPLGTIARLAVSLAAVVACWGGIAFAVGSVARRRAVAGGIVGMTAVGLYLLDYLGRAWSPASAASTVSPFHYFEPMTIVTGGALSVGDVAILLATGVAFGAAGAVAFATRDL